MTVAILVYSSWTPTTLESVTFFSKLLFQVLGTCKPDEKKNNASNEHLAETLSKDISKTAHLVTLAGFRGLSVV